MTKVFGTKKTRALELTAVQLHAMGIEPLQAVAQILGVGPRQPREQLIRAIMRMQEREKLRHANS